MQVFTIEIGGKATLVCAASCRDSAVSFAEDSFVRSELRSLVCPHGLPLWDGAAEITVRPARKPEREVWEAGLYDALRVEVFENREDAIEGGCFSFLVPYHD